MEGNIDIDTLSTEKNKKQNLISLFNSDFKMSMRTKRLKEEQIKYDKIIEELSIEITKKLSYGIDEFNMRLSRDVNLQEIVKYILKKESRNKNHVIILRYYLFKFPSLLETMNLSLKYFETKEILNKIAIHLKKEEVPKNNVVFYNGQIGKTFYMILEGEVSVLLPNEYNIEITMDQYLEYLKGLYEYKDYELLRLSFESNKNILDKYDYEQGDELLNFDYCFDKVLPTNLEKEEIDAQSYINRFLFYENEIEIENENEEEKEKEKEKEKDNVNEIKKIDLKSVNDSTSENQNNNLSDDNSNINKISNKSDESDLSMYSIVQKDISNKQEIEKQTIKRNKKKHNFSLWKYVEIIKLGKGKCFGEIALQNSKNKRTATIISISDCLFGILEKDEYLLFVRETMEKIRRNNIERLLNTTLFKGVSYITFESKYFNCFIFSKENKGVYLFKRGERRNNLIYIKKGEIQLEIIATCKQLDNIILSIGGNPYDNYLYNLIRTNQKIKEFINIPKKFNISIFSQGDFIGTDELVYISSNVLNLDNKYFMGYDINSNKLEEDCFIFNAVYLTNSEVFKLDTNFLKNMTKDSLIKSNYDKLLKDKKERLIQRLLNIKTNTILQYYNLICDSKNNMNIINNNLDEKKNYSFLLNKRKIINNKHFLSLKNINNLKSQDNKIINNNNKINTALNTRNNSFLEEISKNKSKTKDFFYPEQNINKRNDSNYIQKRALLTSFMNNNNYKGKLTKKIFLSGNSTLHNFNSEKNIPVNRNKTYYNTNLSLTKISLTKNNLNFRNINSNLSNNNTVLSNEDNISKNNSSDKMSMYKSLYPIKKPKKLKLSDNIINSFKNPELKILKNQRIPKLLINNALIYNAVIDKIFLNKKQNIFKNPILSKNKNNSSIDKEHKKLFNVLDALAFDDILNNIKNDKIYNQKKFFPIFQLQNNKKRINNNSLPKTTYNFYMKKNK